MSKADNWFESLKDNPQEIIEWAEAEIKEYKKLIAILRKYERKNTKQLRAN